MIDHYLFLLKKFLGTLVMPVPLSLLLLVWALLLMLRRKTRWVGIIVVAVVTAGLIFCSYPPLTQPLIAAYENAVPAYQKNDQPVDGIVVLGSWHQSTPDQPITSEINEVGIVRLVEGIRIYRLNPGSKLIFTGFEGIPEDAVTYPEKLKELAISLGVPADDIITLVGSRDTFEEAQLVAKQYADKNLVLVTTANHMPRALALFNHAGLQPVPAPTGHFTKPHRNWFTFPSAATLAHSEYWLHEELGRLWSELTGQSD